MNELELLVDLHRFSDRQGPGSEKDTLRALEYCDIEAGNTLKVADIGCGSGAQTLIIADHINGEIKAVDSFGEFLERLDQRKNNQVSGCDIETIKASMDDLPFQSDSFDLIWSEGAIYNMGFENGIKYWNPFLKMGGHLVVSEITWTTTSRPTEIQQFWEAEYPEIAVASDKIKILEANGYSLRGYFVLDESSWIENYYRPLANQFEAFLNRNGKSESALSVVGENRQEIELYHKFKKYYSYGFYIARKDG